MDSINISYSNLDLTAYSNNSIIAFHIIQLGIKFCEQLLSDGNKSFGGAQI